MNAKLRLTEALKTLRELHTAGYDIPALEQATEDCDPEDYRYEIGPANKFWDELPSTMNGLKVILDGDHIYVLDKDTLVAKSRKGFFLV